MYRCQIEHSDNVRFLSGKPDVSIDMFVTSPPYDDLREYGQVSEWSYEVFKKIANEMERTLKPGGVIAWIVQDRVVNGSETGSSFRQALYFIDIGLRLHDTMIWKKLNIFPQTGPRYEQGFEYIFIISKGKPRVFNPINDKPNKYAGTKFHGTYRHKNGQTLEWNGHNKKMIAKFGRRTNVWEIANPGVPGMRHPATFPEQLAKDLILSWSNPGDLVSDIFLGSGTTARAALKTHRKFTGCEINEEYFNMALKSAILERQDTLI